MTPLHYLLCEVGWQGPGDVDLDMVQTHFTILVYRAARVRRAARYTVKLYMPFLNHVLARNNTRYLNITWRPYDNT